MVQTRQIKKKIKKYQITLKRVTKKVLAKNKKPRKIIGKTSKTTVKKIEKSIKKIVIKPNMIISQVIEKYPESIKVFFDYGITCVGCFLASEETIEQGISAHGIDVKKFLEDLNMVASK